MIAVFENDQERLDLLNCMSCIGNDNVVRDLDMVLESDLYSERGTGVKLRRFLEHHQKLVERLEKLEALNGRVSKVG